MGRLFGTDGVRGLANRDITAELAVDLAVAAAHVLAEAGEFAGHRPQAIVGRDSRASGEFLEAAVVAGLASAGLDVRVVGVLPTPGVAWLTARTGADLGVMLSASHNPMPDNGIKFFARGGVKLADELEDAIEARLGEPWERPTGRGVGRVIQDNEAGGAYIEYLAGTIDVDLTGVRVVIDCANGAAWQVAPAAVRLAGADVVAINDQPDGWNINDGCGSTHLDGLIESVRAHGADVGIAHDGDADRCLAVTADGSIVDGDHILAILAMALHEKGRLVGDTVVTTVMANMGFRLAMQSAGIVVTETAVGDRYVLEEMRVNGYVLGGEQSGHIVLSEFATTGDGVLTALQLLAQVARTGRSLGELAAAVEKLPQVLINVAGIDKAAIDTNAAVQAAVRDAENQLAGRGRVLLRPSGTEPVVRVMIEAPTLDDAERLAGAIANVVSAELTVD
ncbi:MAG TPA: phosphoglucosamine mutase [Candidatus Nanopelagicales bacterium]|nr:phosphoglucosamine mutase [Candidatus Nanopelagicales bacterium]